MDGLDRSGKRDRSKSMPKRRAQARIQEQLRAINPVLANPAEFRASLKRWPYHPALSSKVTF